MRNVLALLSLLVVHSACVAASSTEDVGPEVCEKVSPCDGTKCGYWRDRACGELVQCSCDDAAARCSDAAAEGTCELPTGCPVDFCGTHRVDAQTTVTCRCGEGLACEASQCVHPVCVGHAGICGGVWDPLAEQYEPACDGARLEDGVPLVELQAALDEELRVEGRLVGGPTSLQSPTLVTWEGVPHLLVQSSFFWKLRNLQADDTAGYSTPMLLRLDEAGLPIASSRREVTGFGDTNEFGWSSVAGFAASSPEWLVIDNRPDHAWWDNELYLVLPNADGTFTKSEALDRIVENDWLPGTPDPQVSAAVLFADQRTMLIAVAPSTDGSRNEMVIARRSKNTPGTTDFRRQELEDAFRDPRTTPAGLPDPSLAFNYGTFRLSVDGKRLIYTREWDVPTHGHDVREIPIRSLEPLTFGLPLPYRGDRLDNVQYEREVITGVAETADGRWVFWGMHRDQLMRRASLTCP